MWFSHLGRSLGGPYYCEKSSRRLRITMSLARNKQGKLETWCPVSNLKLRVKPTAKKHGLRIGCEDGFRDAK
jgi:hypothetical protein